MGELGITSGCGSGLYCPDREATRGELAVFFIRSWSYRVYGSPNGFPDAPPGPYGGSYFVDVPLTHPFSRWIQKLYQLGITNGCGYDSGGGLLFCPEDPASNLAAAVFSVRTGQITPGSLNYAGAVNENFTDHSSMAYFPNDMPSTAQRFNYVQRIRDIGTLGTGCGERAFCPANAVSRGEASYYVIRGVLTEFPVVRRASASPGISQWMWEPMVAKGGANWIAAWNHWPPSTAAMYVSAWHQDSRTWTAPQLLLAPGGSNVADPYFVWDAPRNRFVCVALALEGSSFGNVYFGYSTDALGMSWTWRAVPVFQWSGTITWDYPSVAEDGQGRIAVGAVRFDSLTTPSGFHSVRSIDGGITFSSPVRITPASVPEVGAVSRIVATNSRFLAFAPRLIGNQLPDSIRLYESTDGAQTWPLETTLAVFGLPVNDTGFGELGCIPGTSSNCGRVFLNPVLDAYGDRGSERWSVVVPINNGGRNNAYICTSDRGCGLVNQAPYHQFMASTTIGSDGSYWVTYLSYTPSVQHPASNAFSQVVRFPPQGFGVGATTTQGSAPASWAPHPFRCAGGSSYVAGDYAKIAPGFDNLTVVAPLFQQAPFKNNELFSLFLSNPFGGAPFTRRFRGLAMLR
jgi:hypothetical protein